MDKLGLKSGPSHALQFVKIVDTCALRSMARPYLNSIFINSYSILKFLRQHCCYWHISCFC